MIQKFCLDRVQAYIDPRAHLVHGELRYSIQQRVYNPTRVKFETVWSRRVLKNTEMARIFNELNPSSPA